MKQRSFWMLPALFTMMVSVSVAFAGTDISGGGDGYASEFIESAKTVLKKSVGRSTIAGSDLPVADLERAIETTQVETTAEALRDSLGFERDALNIPARKLIRVNRQRWSTLGWRQRQVLAIHEYLGILQHDDTAYKTSALIVAAVDSPQKVVDAGGELVSLTCSVVRSTGPDLGQFQVSVFNLARLEYDFRGNRLKSYMLADFYGGGASVSMNIGYAGGDDFGSWSFVNLYDQVGADETAPEGFSIPLLGKVKTFIGSSGYPEMIRPVFTRSSFALRAKDADKIIRGEVNSKKKLKAGFRGVLADGKRFDADLECHSVTDHGRIRNDMFGVIGGVERMLRKSE